MLYRLDAFAATLVSLAKRSVMCAQSACADYDVSSFMVTDTQRRLPAHARWQPCTLLVLCMLVGCGRVGFSPIDAEPPLIPSTPVTCSVPMFQSVSVTEVEVPGSQCSFVVSDSRETWFVFASAQLQGQGQVGPAHLSLFLDDVEAARGDPATEAPAVWQATAFSSVIGTHVVSLRMDSQGGVPSIVSGARIIAVPFGPALDFHGSYSPGLHVLTDVEVPMVTLEVSPEQGGRYAVIANVAMGEQPGGIGINWRVDGPGDWPELHFGRAPLLPHVVARIVDLPAGPTSFTMMGRAGAGSLATLGHPRLIAIRIADDAAATYFTNGNSMVSVAQPLSTQQLALSTPTFGTRWFTFQTMSVSIDPDYVSGGYRFLRDGVVVSDRTQQIIGEELHTPTYADVVTTDGGIILEMDQRMPNTNGTTTAVEASSFAVRLP